MNPTIRQQYVQAQQTELIRQASEARRASQARLAAQARLADSSSDETRHPAGVAGTQPSFVGLARRRLSSALAWLRPATAH